MMGSVLEADVSSTTKVIDVEPAATEEADASSEAKADGDATTDGWTWPDA